jgi:HSP90 family molecular chaperone
MHACKTNSAGVLTDTKWKEDIMRILLFETSGTSLIHSHSLTHSLTHSQTLSPCVCICMCEAVCVYVTFTAFGWGKLTTLDEYISRMKPDQKEIYYLSVPSRQSAEVPAKTLQSAFLESFS